jgi:hypothetical protein
LYKPAYANRSKLTVEEMMFRLDELEQLLQFPRVDGHAGKAGGLAMYIARSAPSGHIANLAMQVMSAASELREGNEAQTRAAFNTALTELRLALRQAKDS